MDDIYTIVPIYRVAVFDEWDSPDDRPRHKKRR